MQEVMYLGNLKTTNTKYGQFVRGRTVDLDDIMAKEVLKIRGFIVPFFLAKYIGSNSDRKISVRRGVISCLRGLWVKLPLSIRYKIRGDSQFQVGPDCKNNIANAILSKQKVDVEKRRVSISHPKPKHRFPVKEEKVASPVSVVQPKIIVERKLSSLGLPKRLLAILKKEEITKDTQVPSKTKLLKIRGIGSASANQILSKIGE